MGVGVGAGEGAGPGAGFGSGVGAGGTAVHCANNVALAVNGNDAPLAYAVPEPFAAVFHPANVNPARVNAFAVNAVAIDADCAAITPEPPFASNVTVNTGAGAGTVIVNVLLAAAATGLNAAVAA